MNLKEDDKLPQGWIVLPLPDSVYFQEGPGLRKKQFAEQGIPFLNIRTFEDGFINKNKCRFVDEKEFTNRYEHFLLNENDIVVSSSGTIGKIAIIRKQDLPVMLNTSVIRFRSKYEDYLLQSYLKYYLQSQHFFQQIDSSKTGSAIFNYGPSHLQQMSILVPPLNEQKRIVAKLEKLLAKVNESCDRLSRIPTILKRFRQSVLASACSGRLTADWRKSHPKIEPAEELLKKDTENEINELPQSWYFVSVGDVIKGLKYGTSKKCSYDNQSHAVLRIPNIVKGVIDCADLKYTELSDKEYETLRLKIGDILMIRSNGSVSLIGKTAMVTQSEEGFAYAGYLIRLRPNLSLIDPRYLNYYLSSYEIRLQIELPARSTSGVNNINSTEVKKLAIAVPPLEEQKEIVKRVKALFRKCDLIEQRYLNAKAYTDKLTQSILAKAFRGELVPQDSNDEPAEVLLERIREETTLTEKSSKGKKTNKRKTT